MYVKTELKVILVKRNITQTELAEKIGLSYGAMNAIVNGKSVPNLTVALKIAGELNLLVEDIWELF